MLMKTLNEIGMIAVDAVHGKRPQHEAGLGTCFDRRTARGTVRAMFAWITRNAC